MKKLKKRVKVLKMDKKNNGFLVKFKKTFLNLSNGNVEFPSERFASH